MDHFVGVRKRDLERISDPQISVINPTELFANTQLIKIFPKSKSIITVQESDSIVDALEVIGKNNITSVPVYSKSSRSHNKFLDVLDIVSFIHQELKNKNIDEKEAAKLDKNDLFKKIGLNDVKVSQVAQFNKRTNFYLFEDKAPARAVLDRICQSNLHRVPILDGEGGLYGVCSQTDLILFVHMHHRLFDDFQNKTVKEIGVGFQKVFTAKNTDSLLQAFAQIHEHNVSGIGVVDEKGSLIGAISGSDVKLVGLDSNIHKLFIPFNTIKSETKEVVHVFPNDKFQTVIDKMVSQHVHRVFILDPNTKTPVGVISQVDVLKKVQEKLN